MNKKIKKNKEILKPQQQSPKASEAAHKAAEADISKDLDLTPPPDPATDLDEGELARLEGGD
ncbi:hypothetical protein [Parafilimonas sp.]|jgi:hypothetical protein|uniref:hypothetical protein n=1 Tax=Parafilimonas sp. TaxID=1969739 RepID=UPI003F7DE6D4